MKQKISGIGLIGCGAIGSSIAKAVQNGAIDGASLIALFDQDIDSAKSLSKKLNNKIVATDSFEQFISTNGMSVVVEAASQKAATRYSRKVVSSGKDLLIMSTGSLLNANLFKDLSNLSRETGSSIFVPSGAIGGIDAIKAARHGLSSVQLTTRKPPQSLSDTAGINLQETKEPIVVFEGNAVEAVKRFPFNINVAATISLAGIGPENTRVKIIADPNAKGNTHEIEAVGESGTMKFVMENVPHPENHMTSYLAVLSAIETLRRACTNSINLGA